MELLVPSLYVSAIFIVTLFFFVVAILQLKSASLRVFWIVSLFFHLLGGWNLVVTGGLAFVSLVDFVRQSSGALLICGLLNLISLFVFSYQLTGILNRQPGRGWVRFFYWPFLFGPAGKSVSLQMRDGSLSEALFWQGSRPVCVFQLFGGAWTHGDPKQLSAYNRFLQSLGFSVMALTYRRLPENVWPTQIDDVVDGLKAGMNLCRKEYGISEFFVSGRSAGGHLALLAVSRLKDPSIKGVIGVYPVTSPKTMLEIPNHTRVLRPQKLFGALFFGEKPGQNFYADADVVGHAHSALPPVLLVHGTKDPVVHHVQSEMYFEKLRELGVDATLKLSPGENHGFEISLGSAGGSDLMVAVEKFLNKLATR